MTREVFCALFSAEFFVPKPNKLNLQYPYNATNPNRYRDYGAWESYGATYSVQDLVYQVAAETRSRKWLRIRQQLEQLVTHLPKLE